MNNPFFRLFRFRLDKNALIEDAVAFKIQKPWIRYLSPLLIVLLLLALFIASQLIVLPILIPLSFLSFENLIISSPLMAETLTFTIQLLLAFMGIYIVLFIWTKFVEQRSFITVGFRGRKRLQKFVIGFLLALISMGITSLFVVILGRGSFNTEMTGAVGWAALPFVLIVWFGWFVQASAEELLFQGWFMPKATKMFGPVIGIALSAGMFTTFHVLNPGITWLAVINLTLYGTFAALYAIYEEGIIGIAAYHIAWNWAQGNVFGLEVSGQSSVRATLVNTTVESQNIFTGYDFGPEGGLIVTIILTLSIFVVSILLQKKQRSVTRKPKTSLMEPFEKTNEV